ncbi:hypothetical protein MAR_008336 [Mya arenaria]|uniref:Uncharacterized protein n=1 Tax=Mya arenaria TaxID=6604 RepID=A0ABY7DYU6_MYAAR|nr:hypothetical protein MAR_008336 [Mya arenaria]
MNEKSIVTAPGQPEVETQTGRKKKDKATVETIKENATKEKDKIQGQKVKKQYELNAEKALKKKLDAANSTTFSIIQTGGGIRLHTNVGMYEFFKHTAYQYYTSDEMKADCTNATDKKTEHC